MAEQIPQDTYDSPLTPPPMGVPQQQPLSPPKTPKSGRGLAVFALLMALAASGGSGALWYLWQQEQLKQVERLEALKRSMNKPNPDLQALQAQVQQIPALEKALETLRTENERLSGQVAGLTGDMQPLKNAMELQKGENSVIKGEISLLRDSQSAQKDDVQKQRGELNQELSAQQGQLSKLGEKLQNLRLSQNTLENDFDVLRTTAAKGGDVNAFPLTEVEYLLHLAENKIKLEYDVDSARLALEIAQQRLKTINETTMAQVQTMLGEAIASLRGVELPDRSALSHKIMEISGQITTLPLHIASGVPDIKNRIKPATDTMASTDPAEGAWWERVGKAILKQFRDIVMIRHIRTDAPPLVAMEEEFFLRQNLRLQLESMRTALLRGDAQTYQDTNQMVREWAARYFDAQDARVATFLSEVKALQTVQFYPYIPDISGINQAFHAAIAQRQPMRSVIKPAAGGNGGSGARAQP